MNVLVLNSGSSSLKYELFDMRSRKAIAGGNVERIGEGTTSLTHYAVDASGQRSELTSDVAASDHRQAIGLVGIELHRTQAMAQADALLGIGHRVVHGGEDFQQPTLIDEDVLAAIRRQAPLAPLHNPANLVGIEATLAEYPEVPQVAVFDTAFHQTLPPYAYRYALPQALYAEHRIRRYGFHGTSHQYVSKRAAEFLGRPLESLNLIVLHLGNGASAAAIQGGRSIDTSMGLTPLEGLMMGTRCGDIDPAVVIHLANAVGMSLSEIDTLLNRESGLKGVCGVNDMREVVRQAEGGSERAELAIQMYCYRIRKYIGAYMAALQRIDAIVFTAGIGENSAEIRRGVCSPLENLGIALDDTKNEMVNHSAREIQADHSSIKLLVVPTDEELEIADQTVTCVQKAKAQNARQDPGE